MYRYMERITEELNVRLMHLPKLPYTNELLAQLVHLKPVEKHYLAKKISNTEWNIGMPNILVLLQKSNILTMSQYIYHQNDNETIQCIFNDLLETEWELLANLVENLGCNNVVSLKITDILEEGFRSIIMDTTTQFMPGQCKYFKELKMILNRESMETVRMLHLKIIFDMESHKLCDAIGEQMQWNQEFKSIDHTLIQQMVSEPLMVLLEALFTNAKLPNFSSWKWWLIILSVLLKSNPTDQIYTKIRQFLKDLFRQFLSQKSDIHLYIMMMVARQLCWTDSDRFGTYAMWYKLAIGEMQYTIQTDEFKYTMHCLTKMIKYERDVEVLKVHANVAISAPAFCSDLVFSYKQICKSMLLSMSSAITVPAGIIEL